MNIRINKENPDSPEGAILNCAQNWLRQHHNILLFTVVNTWGTSPRPPGSIMIMSPSGEITGSVSGGCIEEDLCKHRLEFFSKDKPFKIEYGISSQQAAAVSLPCGGRIEMIIEKLTDANHISIIIDAIQQGCVVYRKLDLQSGKATISKQDDNCHGFYINEKSLIKRFGCTWKLILIGANQISYYLTKVAAMLGYQSTVIESRKEYIHSWQFPEIALDEQYPDEALTNMVITPYTAIVTLTHDPQLDDRSLVETINTPAFYLGVLGSLKTHMLRKKRLLRYGFTQDELSRLHAPVGLPIGSKTPSEIAVSIMAEITAVRNKVIFGSHDTLYAEAKH